nr:hypothetical protein [Otarine picobirnavirus]
MKHQNVSQKDEHQKSFEQSLEEVLSAIHQVVLLCHDLAHSCDLPNDYCRFALRKALSTLNAVSATLKLLQH